MILASVTDYDDGWLPMPAPSVNALGAFIRSRLDVLGMSPMQLAEASGVSRSTIYRWMGDKPPETIDPGQLDAVAAALEVDPAGLRDLFHGRITAVAGKGDERDAVVHGFVLSTSDLSLEELRRALEIAEHAANLAREARKPPPPR